MALEAPSVAGVVFACVIGPLALHALFWFALQIYAGPIPHGQPWGCHCLRRGSDNKYAVLPDPQPQVHAPGAVTMASHVVASVAPTQPVHPPHPLLTTAPHMPGGVGQSPTGTATPASEFALVTAVGAVVGGGTSPHSPVSPHPPPVAAPAAPAAPAATVTPVVSPAHHRVRASVVVHVGPARTGTAADLHAAQANHAPAAVPVVATNERTGVAARPRVEPYSLHFWFHKLGFAQSVVFCVALLDPAAEIGLYPEWTVRLINTWAVFIVLMLASVWQWFALVLLYRDAHTTPPRHWLYALIALPFVYLIGTDVVSFVPLYVTQRFVWDLPSAISFAVTTALYAVLLPCTYFRVRATLRGFLESIHRSGTAGAGFDTSHIERGLTNLSRFVVLTTLLTAVVCAVYVVVVAANVRKALDDPNARPEPVEKLDATQIFLTAVVMLVLYAVLWYSWIPLRFAGAAPRAAAAAAAGMTSHHELTRGPASPKRESVVATAVAMGRRGSAL